MHGKKLDCLKVAQTAGQTAGQTAAETSGERRKFPEGSTRKNQAVVFGALRLLSVFITSQQSALYIALASLGALNINSRELLRAHSRQVSGPRCFRLNSPPILSIPLHLFISRHALTVVSKLQLFSSFLDYLLTKFIPTSRPSIHGTSRILH